MNKINSNLIIYIYNKKKNLIDKKDFKKLVLSSGIKYINKYISIRIRYPNIKYFFGLGKLLELKRYITKYNFSNVFLNIDLKGLQEFNLKKKLNCCIFNKTTIILNIFKRRVNTIYGKLQVKLAYLNYLSNRLVRRWTHLERQKGGIRYISGPGEKQIEIDRRIIKKKIKNIYLNLNKNILQRRKRDFLRNEIKIPRISLVGYTNSGKSTLFNLLTNSNIYCKNYYFSTLDTYIKKIKIFKFYCDVLLSDTIGFIKKLPKSIIKAFKSTLYEINKSNLIFHIVDVSNIYFNNYIDIVNNILLDININNIPVILLMNKIDLLPNFNKKIEFDINKNPYRIWISAKKKIGINYIYKIINFYFFNNFKKYIIKVPVIYFDLIKNYLYNNCYIINKWSYNKYYYFIYIFINKKKFLYLINKYSFIKKNYE